MRGDAYVPVRPYCGSGFVLSFALQEPCAVAGGGERTSGKVQREMEGGLGPG